MAVAAVALAAAVAAAGSTVAAQNDPPPTIGAPVIDHVIAGDESLTVIWSAPSGDGITAYDVRHIASGATDKADANWTRTRLSPTGADLQHLVLDLVNGTGYDTQVRAVAGDTEGDWSSTSTGTPSEPGATNDTAATIETVIGSELRIGGSLGVAGDIDRYKFVVPRELEATHLLDFYAFTTGDIDTVGTLRDSADRRIRFNDNSRRPSDGLNFLLSSELLSGTYYLDVAGHDAATGDYQLHIGWEHDTNFVVYTRTLEVGQSANLVTSYAQPDTFRLTVSETTRLALWTTGDMAATQIEIKSTESGDPRTYERVAILNNSRYMWHAYNHTGGIIELSAGTYTVAPRPKFLSLPFGTTGLMTLFTAKVPEPADDRDEAKLLNVGVMGGGTLAANDTSQYYRIEVPQRGRYIVRAATVDFKLSGTLTDSDGSTVAGGTYHARLGRPTSFGTYQYTYAGELDAGTYYFGVSRQNGTEAGDWFVQMLPDEAMDRMLDRCGSEADSISDPLYGCQWNLHGLDSSGSSSYEGINLGTVWDDFDGEGINIAVVDEGLDPQHEDLAANVDKAKNRTYTRFSVSHESIGHGTSVAGIIAARDNSRGLRGAAPRAKVYAHDALKAPVFSNIAHALSHGKSYTAVSNNSWGLSASPGTNLTTGTLAEEAIESGISAGFGDKGVSYVFASGNGYTAGALASLTELLTHHGVTAVCAVDALGKQAAYSTPGTNLWICAPSSSRPAGLPNITTATRYNRYRTTFGGTSAAAPTVSGVVALVRQANPALTWRDVRLILADTARKNDASDEGWATGAVKYSTDAQSYNFNDLYGFGVVDATAAVEAAQSWTLLPEFQMLSAESLRSERVIAAPVESDAESEAESDAESETESEAEPAPTTSSVVVVGDVDFVEYVEVEVDLPAPNIRNLQIELVSPSGTVSVLSKPSKRLCGIRPCSLSGKFRFATTRHLGENPFGEWTLRIADRQAEAEDALATLWWWQIRVYGHKSDKQPVQIDYVRPGTGQLTLAWSVPDGVDTDAITGFDVRHIRSDASDFADDQWTLIDNAAASTGRSYVLTGVAADVRRSVQVRARGARANPWSAAARGTPGAANSEPAFGEGERTWRTVAETAAVGAKVGVPVTARDAENETVYFTLPSDSTTLFEIDESTGQLSVRSSLDYETQGGVHKFQIEVSDRKDNSGAADNIVDDMIAMIVVVRDVNEELVFAGPTAIDVPENFVGVVGRYEVWDPEGNYPFWTTQTSDEHTWFQRRDEGNGTFALSNKAAFNYEAPVDINRDNVYEIDWQVTDGDVSAGGSGMRHNVAIRVTVTDVNEVPAFTAGPVQFGVPEGAFGVIATYAAADPDGDVISFSLIGDDASRLAIDASSGGLRFAVGPNFEQPGDADGDNVYDVTVVAADAAGLRALRPVSVTVTDVNETPAFTEGRLQINWPEGALGVIGTYAADDPDGDVISFTLVGDDRSRLTIDASGRLRFAVAPDFEQPGDADGDNVYDVTVVAADGGLTALRPVLIIVTNEDDAPPPPPPPGTLTVAPPPAPGPSPGAPPPAPPGGPGGGGGAADSGSGPRVVVLRGSDRYATALAAARAFATDAGASSRRGSAVTEAVVASGRSFADALAATALGGRAPLLLTPPDRLDPAARRFIEEHGIERVHVAGGTAAVSAQVEAELAGIGSVRQVTRLWGADRYATAVRIAEKVGEPAAWCGSSAKTALLASGRSFADALALGPLAALGPHPLLLSERASLPAPVRDWFAAQVAAKRLDQVIVAGGASVIADSVLAELRGLGLDVVRLAGSDRYATAAAIARHALEASARGSGESCLGRGEVLVTTGAGFADGLAGGPLGGVRAAPMLLVPPAGPTAEVLSLLSSRRFDHGELRVSVLGGSSAVSRSSVSRIADAIEQAAQA